VRGRTFAFLALLALLPTGTWAQEAPAEEDLAPASQAVLEVRLEGNRAFKSKDLLDAAGLLPTKKFYLWNKSLSMTSEEVAERLGEIALFYQRRGYFEATVMLEGVGDGVATATVAECEPSRVSHVSLAVEPAGAWGPVSEEALLPTLPLKEGGVFTVQAYEDAADVSARAWKEAGFPFVKVTTEAVVDQAAHRVEVTLRISPGEALAVGPVRFEGAEGLEEEVLRRAVFLCEGEPWRQSLVDKSSEALFRLGLFEGVSITPQADGAQGGRVPVVVRLRQGTPMRIKVGLGYGTEDGARVRFGWETARVGDRILAFGVDSKISQRESSGLVFARRPYFRNPYTTLSADAFLGHRYELDFDYRSFKMRLGFDRSVGKLWKWSLYAAGEKLLEVNTSKSLAVAVPPGAVDLSVLSSVSISATRDTTDAPLNPTRGTILSAYVEPTMVDTGRRSFMKTIVEGRVFFTPVSRIVLALKLKVGAILTGGDPNEIPLSRRFYAGGSMSVRGYRYNGLGPLADNGALLGGEGLVESSMEVRFPVKGDIMGLVFLDAGNALGSPLRTRELKLYSGAGFGVRLNTPVGPIGVDLGFKLRKDPKDRSGWALHVFVGYAF
jgi:outer membrane protein assembly complex protein YaeT